MFYQWLIVNGWLVHRQNVKFSDMPAALPGPAMLGCLRPGQPVRPLTGQGRPSLEEALIYSVRGELAEP